MVDPRVIHVMLAEEEVWLSSLQSLLCNCLFCVACFVNLVEIFLQNVFFELIQISPPRYSSVRMGGKERTVKQ